MKAYVGVDWSASQAVVSAAGEEGKPRRMRSVAPVMGEVRELIAEVRRQFGATEVLVFVEAGATIWMRLFAAAGATVHAVDPKQAHRFAESLTSSDAKDDRRDADTMVDLGRSPRHRPAPWTPDDTVERLTRHSTRRERLVEDRTREVQRLREDLCLTMPLVEAVIETFESKWVRRLLALAPTAWHLAQVPQERLLEALQGARAATLRRVLAAVERTEVPWLTAAAAEDEAAGVHQALERLKVLDGHILAADEAIDAILAAIPMARTLQGIEGIGPQLTVALLVFGLLGTGDRDAAGVRMGAAPVFRGSGKRRDGTPKGAAWMRRTVPPRARQATYLLGRLAVMHHAWAQRQFTAARQRGKKAATAYRQVARSFLRILQAMVRDGTEYDADRYESALAARGVKHAA